MAVRRSAHWWNLPLRLVIWWFAGPQGGGRPSRTARRPRPPGGPGSAGAGVPSPLPRPPGDLLAGAEAHSPTDPEARDLYLPHQVSAPPVTALLTSYLLLVACPRPTLHAAAMPIGHDDLETMSWGQSTTR
jgi:hypothetical protein